MLMFYLSNLCQLIYHGRPLLFEIESEALHYTIKFTFVRSFVTGICKTNLYVIVFNYHDNLTLAPLIVLLQQDSSLYIYNELGLTFIA